MAEALASLLDGTVRAANDVFPGGFGILGTLLGLPFIPRQECQVGLVAEPPGHCFGIVAQRHRAGRHRVKRFPRRRAPIAHRTDNQASNVVGMNVVHGLHTKIGKRQLLTARQCFKYRVVEMACRIERRPALSNNVSGMNKGGGKSLPSGQVEQVRLNSRLRHAIRTKWTFNDIFRGRHNLGIAMRPDGPDMYEVLNLAEQGPRQLLRALEREANIVDHDVGFIFGYCSAKVPRLLQRLSIKAYAFHIGPGIIFEIRLGATATDGNHFVAGMDETGNKIATDMAGGSDNNDTRHKSAILYVWSGQCNMA